MTLGERIRDCRIRAGLSQEKLAELAEVSRQAVGKWESGQAAPGAEKLQRLADIFGESMTPPAAADRDAADAPPAQSPAEQPDAASAARELFALAEREKAAKAAARRKAHKQNALRFFAVCAAYLLLYLLGRLIWCGGQESAATGWLFSKDIHSRAGTRQDQTMPSAPAVSSSVVPWRMKRPFFMMITWSEIYSISDTICVEIIMILSCAISAITFRKYARSFGSSPAVGSSMIRIFGSFNSAWAIPSLRFIPPEKVRIFRFMSPSRLTSFISSLVLLLAYRGSSPLTEAI